MILSEVFEEFVSVIKENNCYVIGIVNENQTVELCSNAEEIGTQKEVAHCDEQNIFYDINVNGQFYGYFWISGHDENLKMISKLLKESLVVRLMYETNRTTLNQKVTKDDELIKYILDIKNFDMNQVLNLINELEIDRNKARVAIYLISNEGFNIKDVMRLKMKPDSKEIIYSLLDNKSLLIFKDLPEDNKMKGTFKQYISEYIQSLQEWEIHNCYYFVGSIQQKLRQYSVSYANCLWLKNNTNFEKDKPVFFNDYLYEYYMSKIKVDDVRDIFEYYREKSKGIDLDELIEIADQLFINDFNLTQTAEDLFLHKNTLIYKLKKYEEIYQIDIRGSFQGKALLSMISYSLKEYQKRKQVGDEV